MGAVGSSSSAPAAFARRWLADVLSSGGGTAAGAVCPPPLHLGPPHRRVASAMNLVPQGALVYSIMDNSTVQQKIDQLQHHPGGCGGGAGPRPSGQRPAAHMRWPPVQAALVPAPRSTPAAPPRWPPAGSAPPLTIPDRFRIHPSACASAAVALVEPDYKVKVYWDGSSPPDDPNFNQEVREGPKDVFNYSGWGWVVCCVDLLGALQRLPGAWQGRQAAPGGGSVGSHVGPCWHLLA